MLFCWRLKQNNSGLFVPAMIIWVSYIRHVFELSILSDVIGVLLALRIFNPYLEASPQNHSHDIITNIPFGYNAILLASSNVHDQKLHLFGHDPYINFLRL